MGYKQEVEANAWSGRKMRLPDWILSFMPNVIQALIYASDFVSAEYLSKFRRILTFLFA